MDDVTWNPLSEHVWTARVDPHGVTCGLVIGAQHLLMVDTGSTPQQGAALAMTAARALGRTVDRVVITHHHDDHVGGLAGIEGAESWMHRKAVAHCERVQVDHPLSLLAYVDLGGLGAEVIHPGPGHTDGDLMVRVEADQITFVGDLLETSGDPQCDSTSDLWNWAGALDSVISASNGKDRYVPGHGEPVTAEQVMAQRNDIWSCVDQVRTAMEAGTQPDQLVAELDRGSDRWPFSAETMREWIPRIGEALVARGVTRPNLLGLTPTQHHH